MAADLQQGVDQQAATVRLAGDGIQGHCIEQGLHARQGGGSRTQDLLDLRQALCRITLQHLHEQPLFGAEGAIQAAGLESHPFDQRGNAGVAEAGIPEGVESDFQYLFSVK